MAFMQKYTFGQVYYFSKHKTDALYGIEIAEKNITEQRSDYVFYTDGFWYKKEEGIKNRMGSTWVQLDRKEEIVSLVGKIRVVDWPLSTRSELVAILCALLVVKSDSLVVVKTVSLAAISSIEKLYKVKAHDGVVWNKLADKLAKKAAHF
ncbi:hypothetical protein C2G38_2225868 [Gigaspora rosea]|uniref:RNase H type-1 domain-containing protein n=1 Tax=Gigaspora rosea TaxID=44941 RepID=A0A397U2A9_9GLOM|nr:hypothetical protein C2G38_2225868 [Gigaspora rosea]